RSGEIGPGRHPHIPFAKLLGPRPATPRDRTSDRKFALLWSISGRSAGWFCPGDHGLCDVWVSRGCLHPRTVSPARPGKMASHNSSPTPRIEIAQALVPTDARHGPAVFGLRVYCSRAAAGFYGTNPGLPHPMMKFPACWCCLLCVALSACHKSGVVDPEEKAPAAHGGTGAKPSGAEETVA